MEYSDLSEVKLTDIAIKDNPYVFKNDCGQGYHGGQRFTAKTSGPIHVQAGDIIIKNPTPVKYGLEVGSGDLIGWRPIKITPELVGKTIGVFLSIEIKTKNDKPSRDQIIWYLNLRLSGCIAEILHCNKKLTVDEFLAMSRRSDKAAEVKDKIIDNLFQELKMRGGVK